MDQLHSEKNRRAVLVATTMSAFLSPLALSVVNVALPSIGKEFAADAILLSWVAMAFTLTAAVFLVPLGRVADIYGRNRIFIHGTWIFTIASCFLGISSSVGMLIFFRALQGVGAAMLFGTMIAILVSVYPVEERGRVLGINVAAVYLGLSVGPFFGGILTQHLGWRSIFFINVPLGLAIIIISIWKLRTEQTEAKGETFDFVGAFIYGAMLLSIMYGFSLLPSKSGLVSVFAGIVGIGAFVRWETRAKSPVLDVSLFKANKVFALSNIAALVNYGATFAVGFLLSFYLQHIKGLSPQSAGIVLVSQPIVQAIFSPVAGSLSDRVEPRIVASTGMAMTAAGLFLLALLQESTPLLYIVMSLIILGFGFALFSSPNSNAIMSSVDNRFYGVASSILATMRLIGQMLSMGIAMLLFALYMGKVEILPVYYPLLLKSTKAAFTVFGFLCVGGIFASLTRGNLR